MPDYVFNKDRPMPDWIRPETETCCRAHARAMWQAQPAWACPATMRAIYRRARKLNQTVDHIVPLRHPLVCGLHTHENLRVVPLSLNLKLGNRWWEHMPDEQLDMFGDQWEWPASWQLRFAW